MAKKQKPLTRKELSRLERERTMQRYVVLGVGGLLVLVVLVLVAGLVYDRVLLRRQPIARVGDRTATVAEYQKLVNLERYLLYRTMRTLGEQLRQLPADESAGFLRQVYVQRLQQLSQEYQGLPNEVFERLIQDMIIEARAAQLGLTVTEEEITKRIEEQMAREINAITPDELDATATAVVEATATAAVWTPTPTVEITATATATATEEVAITQPLTPTATPQPTATPNVLTPARFEEVYRAFLAELQEQVGITEAEYRQFVRRQLLREKVQQYVADQVPTEEEQVYLKAVILPTEEEAQALLEEIRAGTPFDEAVEAYARQRAGDLGWFGRGQMVPAFEEAAFSLQPGEISDPVETEFGWHIIQVTDRDDENGRVRARHILVESREAAEEVKRRLEAGEDFAELARELSQDTASVEGQGVIDVGWIVRDQPGIPEEVLDAAFQLRAGEVSDPISLGDTGFVLAFVEQGPEVRPLSPDILAQRRDDAFQAWLREQRAELTVERLWHPSKVPGDPFEGRLRDLLRLALSG